MFAKLNVNIVYSTIFRGQVFDTERAHQVQLGHNKGIVDLLEQAIRWRAHTGYRGLQHAAREVIICNTPTQLLDDLPLPQPLITFIKSELENDVTAYKNKHDLQ